MSTSRRSCLDSSWYVVLPAVGPRATALLEFPKGVSSRRRSSIKISRIVFCVRCEWPACTGPVCVLWA
jgi:hypothetical protein